MKKKAGRSRDAGLICPGDPDQAIFWINKTGAKVDWQNDKHEQVVWVTPAGRDIGLDPDAEKQYVYPTKVTVDISRPAKRTVGIVSPAKVTIDVIFLPDQVRMPPAIGEALIVLFCPNNRVDAVMGDLAERFSEEAEAKGEKRAKLLFWARAVRSVGPLPWVKVRNGGLWAMLFEIGRRLIGS
jgi:hypothetical protein